MNQDSRPKIGPALQAMAEKECKSLNRWLVPRGDRHHRVHQARKCCRRLRSLVALADVSSTKDAAAALRDLKRLQRSLSALRDAYMAVHTAWIMEAHEPYLSPGTLHALERRGNDLLDETLHSDPDWQQRRKLAARIASRLDNMAWRQVAPASLRHALRYSARRARKARKAALDRRTSTAFHRWRRRARQLRYQLEFLCKAGRATDMKRRRMKRHAARIKRLALVIDRLGWRQDFLVLRKALRALPPSDEVIALRKSLQREIRSATASIAIEAGLIETVGRR